MTWGAVVRVSVLAIFTLSTTVRGQSPTANIVGVVRDQSGGVVPSAEVTVRHTTTREVRRVLTGDNGEFTVPLLPPGNYRIVVVKPGFHRMDERDVTLEIDRTLRLDFTLQVGAVSETVEVTASSVP